MKYISVCISAYEMGGKGAEYLRFSFEKLIRQTFTDFEVVISDQSKNDAIENVCKEYSGRLDIRYFRESPKASPSENTNNAIRRATGKLIKILFLDDFLYSDTSLETIATNFNPERDRWLLTACIHSTNGVDFYRPFYPRYDDAQILFKNTVSAPSVLTMKNENIVLFDDKLIWWQDLDFYKRCFERFGAPKILNEVNVAIRTHANQMGNSSALKRREDEFRYVLKKHRVPNAWRLFAAYRIKRYVTWVKGTIKKAIGTTCTVLYRKLKERISRLIVLWYYRLRLYPLKIRKNTSDASVIRQVFINKQYDLDYGDMAPKMIIDAGANVGYTSAFFAKKFPNAEIFSIEPDADNFQALRKNVSRFGRVHPIKKGLWHEKSGLKVVDQGLGEWAFKTEEAGPGEQPDIEAITVDELLALAKTDNVDILKLDIEGAEKELFSRNYASWLDKVDMLIIELHDRMRPGSSETFYTAIRKYGFIQEARDELIILRKMRPGRKNEHDIN